MLEQIEFLNTNLQPEEQILLCCARTWVDAAHARRITTLLQGDIDWDYVLQLAFRHNVAPLLFRSLEAVAPSAVPRAIRAQLKEQIQVYIQGNLFLTRELLNLLTLFERHSIPAIPYKGPVLAVSVYGDLGLRPSNDLDILVQERHLLQAMQVLVSHGYQMIRPSSIAQLEKDLQSIRINELIQKSLWAYQLIFSHPERQGIVELHWRITPKYVFPNNPARLWENLKPVMLGGSMVLTFSPENLLWFLCVHGTKHQWIRLSWLCDIAELIRAYPDLNWEQVLVQATKLGIERRLYLGLLLVSCLLETPLPRAIEKRIHSTPHIKILSQQVMEKVFDGARHTSRIPYFERFIFQLKAMDHITDRGRFLLRFAVEWTAWPKLNGHL
jgi:hypothetical protein